MRWASPLRRARTDMVWAQSRSVVRSGLTLIELLLSVALMLCLVGLLLPGIQSARRAASRADTMNRLRQITLAQRHYLVDHPEPIPRLGETAALRGGGCVFKFLVPYIENAEPIPGPGGLRIPIYVNPADPSFGALPSPSNEGNCSFAVNARLYISSGNFSDITDGQSNTIAFSERYARCNRQDVIWSLSEATCYGPGGVPVKCGVTSPRRANYADDSFMDALPTTTSAGQTTSTLGDVTFQDAPRPVDCDGRMLQSSLPGGLIVSLADGSVRRIASSVDAMIFWAAVTPSSGEPGPAW